MELNEFKFKVRRIVLDLAELMFRAASDESIKKNRRFSINLVSTALALLVEAVTLEKGLEAMLNLRSDNSISE